MECDKTYLVILASISFLYLLCIYIEIVNYYERPENLTLTFEHRLIAEVSNIAGYHYRREIEINKSWEKLLSSSCQVQGKPLVT